MSDDPPPVSAIPVAEHEVARRVLRWLAVGGVVLGAAQLLSMAAVFVAWGPSVPALSNRAAVQVLYRVVVTLAAVAPAILVVGSLGLLREKRWARPTLTLYASIQIVGAVAWMAVGFAMNYEAQPGPGWTAAQQVHMVFSGVENMLLRCLYPAAVLLCLVRPGLMTFASPAAATFEVLPPVAARGGATAGEQ